MRLSLSSFLPTWQTTPIADPPAELISLTVWSMFYFLRLEMTTWQPSADRRWAMALPMPVEEAVMMATLPLRS